ncbi:MAG: serine/threonine protein kinase [Gammaproteobacteria bacterium]
MEIKGYRIEQQIGEGGMAVAYLAVQESLGRMVVLKILNASRRNSPYDLERFVDEGRLIASLNHPNIVTIYDIGTSGDQVYMSMEYVEGGDLRKRMRGLVDPGEALDIVVKVAGGLSAAHKKGIVHRDVKPGNVLFRKDGTPLLSDFGIAKQLTVDKDLTQTGIFLGSPNYMAPEQAETGAIDGRADIYSLGVIFFEMLTGTKPYQSESVIDVILQHKRAPLPVLPPGLEDYQALLELMMAKSRKDRFRDADSLVHYVHHLTQRPTAKPASEGPGAVDLGRTSVREGTLDKVRQLPLLRTGNSRRTLYGLAAILAVVGLGYGGLYYAQRRIEAPPQRTPAPLGLDISGDFDTQDRVAAGPMAAPEEIDKAAMPGPSPQEVIKALAWLGQKSLEEDRLVQPPKDNAYYYFSRLLKTEAGRERGREGLAQIAERFALLAEREIAQDNYEGAQRYIKLGLQIEPAHQALRSLDTLTRERPQGFFEVVSRFFVSG